jgi:hypothetical protein
MYLILRPMGDKVKKRVKGKWVEKYRGETYIWFPSPGRYLNFSDWRELATRIGKQRLTGHGR